MPQLFIELIDGLMRSSEIDVVISHINVNEFVKESRQGVFPGWQVLTQGCQLVDDQSQGRISPAPTPDVFINGRENPQQLKVLQLGIRLASAINQDGLAFLFNLVKINAWCSRAKHCPEISIQIEHKHLIKIW